MEQAPRSNALGSTQEQCYPSQEQARSKPGASQEQYYPRQPTAMPTGRQGTQRTWFCMRKERATIYWKNKIKCETETVSTLTKLNTNA